MKHSYYSIFLLFIIILGNIPTITAINSTLYVDDDGTADYTSIQTAINAATDGDTIFVYNGEYHESLHVDKSLHIMGEDRDNTIINRTGSALITIEHDHVHFEGFSLINAADVWLDDAAVISVFSDNTIIENNVIQTNLYNGIKLHPRTKENSIIHNIITAGYAGLRLKWSWNNYISHNYFFGHSIGINMAYSWKNQIQRNQLESNGIGLFLIDCYRNNVSQNNFMNGGDEVYMHPRVSINSWNSNYWQEYTGKLPFYIITQRYIPFTDIPLFFLFDILRIDWSPSSEPYEIEGE